MHLTSVSSDPRLVKGKILQHYKSLIAYIYIYILNPVLVEQSFHSTLSGNEDLKYNTLQTGNFTDWKRYLQKALFDLIEKTLIRYC